MGLNVIGTGFGRTGTDSMREALNLLGFGPCHHMLEILANAEQRTRWRAMVAGERADWDHLFEGYRACVDWPSAHYWRALIAAYPEAKVILTWRTPESWWNSFSRTILNVMREPADEMTVGRHVVTEAFGGRFADRDHAIATYRAHVEAVLTEVPPGRLLVHRLGDGWAPLCAHLGVPVPDVPYPHSNTAEAFNARREQD